MRWVYLAIVVVFLAGDPDFHRAEPRAGDDVVSWLWRARAARDHGGGRRTPVGVITGGSLYALLRKSVRELRLGGTR